MTPLQQAILWVIVAVLAIVWAYTHAVHAIMHNRQDEIAIEEQAVLGVVTGVLVGLFIIGAL